jgi:hypothetical protein
VEKLVNSILMDSDDDEENATHRKVLSINIYCDEKTTLWKNGEMDIKCLSIQQMVIRKQHNHGNRTVS